MYNLYIINYNKSKSITDKFKQIEKQLLLHKCILKKKSNYKSILFYHERWPS